MDIVGYSRLVGLDDVGTVERFRELRLQVIDPELERHSGRVVQTAGDSLLVIFTSVAEAVTCALAVQRGVALHCDDRPHEQEIRFRIGIEMGDVLADGLDLHGETVSIAARLEAVCPPGAVCISRAVHEHIKHTVAAQFTHVGQLELKNIARPVDAFVVDPMRAVDEVPSAPALRPTDSCVRIYPSPAGGAPFIAVLPFDEYGEARVPNHVADGIVADIVCQLAGLRELRVISHGSTLRLRGSAADPRETGRRLGAHYVARGALHHLGRRTRLITELIDSHSGEVVLARNIETGNVLSFKSQDRIVGQIVNTLAPRVQEIELRRIRGSRPESLSVYEKVLLAREHITMLQPNGFAQAKKLLDDVIEQEPEYAEAYALAADWHGLMIGQGWSADRAADTAAVDELTLHALSLDGDNVRALVYYGHRKSLLHRDYPSAMKLFERALNVSPSSAHGWLKSSYTFAYIGEPAEAIRRSEHALELSPCDREPHLFYSALCTAHYTAGNYDVAADWGMRTLSERTMLRGTAAWTAASLAAAGRVKEANEVRQLTISQWPHHQIRDSVARHPYQDQARRERFGEHLLAAGYPP